MSLAERYRPHTFAEVVGQPHAVEIIQRLAQRADPPPLLLTGPFGTGKTTLARIFARAINCKSPTPSGAPCLHCASCALFGTNEETWIYTEVAAGVTGEKDHARYIHELARTRPMLDVAYRVILLDEAHLLTVPAQETLLSALEFPKAAAFVLATTAPSRLIGPLRSRCQRLTLRLLSHSELIAHGMRVCADEGIEPEVGALALLAVDADGHVRDFLLSLEQFTHNGVLRVADVANGLDLAWANIVLRALLALAQRDCSGAKRILREWTAPADRKADALRDGLIHVAHIGFTPARTAPEASAAFLLASSALVEAVIAQLRVATGGFGVQPLQYVWGLAHQWARCAPHLRDEGDLEVALFRAAYALSPSDPQLPELPLEPVASPPRRARRARASATATRPTRRAQQPEYLTSAHVRAQYRAATMLPQRFGLWFNARLRVPFGAYGVTAFVDAMTFMSDLKRALRLRLRNETGDGLFLLHFLQQNELDENGYPVAWLLLHVPSPLLASTHVWLASQLPKREDELLPSMSEGMWRAPQGGRPAAVHWQLMRDLWRAIDPNLHVQSNRRSISMKDALGVPVQGPRTAGVLPPRMRRWSASDDLDGAAWVAAHNEKFGFVCAYSLGLWEVLARGWELDEFEHRKAELVRRAEEIARIEAQFPQGLDAATDLTREQKVRTFLNNLPFDPLARKRSRALW